jgi:hypothetical protein
LRPHAATRWAWSDTWPIHTLWSRNRADVAHAAGDVRWAGEGVLLTRPSGAVLAAPLSRGGAELLHACAAGTSIEEAVGGALGAAPETDIAALFDQLLTSGAFCALTPATPSSLKEDQRCLPPPRTRKRRTPA